MPVSTSEYEAFLRLGDVVNVGIDLPDRTFAEDCATVIAGKAGEITLRLCGSGLPAHLQIDCGSRVVISKGEATTLFHCTAQLKASLEKNTLRMALPEKVIVKDRREYQRADVSIPVNYYLPETQNMGKVIDRWERLRGCSEECLAEGATIQPIGDSRVNLSGSGVRFKIRDCLSYGTLLHLKISLPEEHIHAVGAIIRTKELIPEMAHIEYYSTSMAFRMIESRDRQKLLKYILDEQRQSLAARPPGYLCTG
jgi:c-di-GMP-binding flagellar brake protein YcgR